MVEGSCLCGGVGFEVRGGLTPMVLCHAARCRKASGAAFGVEVAARAADFSWTRGEGLVSTYEAPLLADPPAYRRAFCRVCGSPLPVRMEETEFMVLQAGLLDDDPGTKPFRHVFVGQKAPWYDIADALPRFEGQPPPEQRLPGRDDFKA